MALFNSPDAAIATIEKYARIYSFRSDAERDAARPEYEAACAEVRRRWEIASRAEAELAAVKADPVMGRYVMHQGPFRRILGREEAK